MSTSYLDKLNQRYACKAMNGETVPQEKVDRILEAARMAPTSSGLQPFEIIVVTNPEMKAKLSPAAHNQPQITGCSHLLIFAAWDAYTQERINEVFDLMEEVRGFSEGAEAYRQNLLASYPQKPAEESFQHASKQAYIALMSAMAQAAFEDVDSTPMEGFIPAQIDSILDLNARGLKSSVLLALGYKDAEKDWLLPMKKVRKPMSTLVTVID